MTIRHSITYTVNGYERTTVVLLSRKLSHVGAQRVIRRMYGKNADVVRVETAIQK